MNSCQGGILHNQWQHFVFYRRLKGGGMHLVNGAAANHCIVSSNAASYGGGLYLQDGTCAYSDIIGNTGHGIGANRGGGGVYVSNTGLVENCRIMHNISTNAAGINLWDGNNIKLRNCLIAGNVSTGSVYGVYVYRGTGLFSEFHNCQQPYTDLWRWRVSILCDNYGGKLRDIFQQMSRGFLQFISRLSQLDLQHHALPFHDVISQQYGG